MISNSVSVRTYLTGYVLRTVELEFLGAVQNFGVAQGHHTKLMEVLELLKSEDNPHHSYTYIPCSGCLASCQSRCLCC
jgi:hypothetical protein